MRPCTFRPHSRSKRNEGVPASERLFLFEFVCFSRAAYALAKVLNIKESEKLGKPWRCCVGSLLLRDWI